MHDQDSMGAIGAFLILTDTEDAAKEVWDVLQESESAEASDGMSVWGPFEVVGGLAVRIDIPAVTSILRWYHFVSSAIADLEPSPKVFVLGHSRAYDDIVLLAELLFHARPMLPTEMSRVLGNAPLWLVKKCLKDLSSRRLVVESSGDETYRLRTEPDVGEIYELWSVIGRGSTSIPPVPHWGGVGLGPIPEMLDVWMPKRLAPEKEADYEFVSCLLPYLLDGLINSIVKITEGSLSKKLEYAGHRDYAKRLHTYLAKNHRVCEKTLIESGIPVACRRGEDGRFFFTRGDPVRPDVAGRFLRGGETRNETLGMMTEKLLSVPQADSEF